MGPWIVACDWLVSLWLSLKAPLLLADCDLNFPEPEISKEVRSDGCALSIIEPY